MVYACAVCVSNLAISIYKALHTSCVVLCSAMKYGCRESASLSEQMSLPTPYAVPDRYHLASSADIYFVSCQSRSHHPLNPIRLHRLLHLLPRHRRHPHPPIQPSFLRLHPHRRRVWPISLKVPSVVLVLFGLKMSLWANGCVVSLYGL